MCKYNKDFIYKKKEMVETIIRIKKGQNIREDVVDDDYFNMTVTGFKNAIEDISILIESNLEKYMDKDIIKTSMELYGNTDICVDKLRHKLMTLLYYIKDLKIENNTVEFEDSRIMYGLSAITNTYCNYNLLYPFNQNNYEVKDVIDNFIKYKKMVKN